MLLTITTTHSPATDLGYLLYKNPDKVQSFGLSFGQAHVFYPEASAERCTAALLLDVDPVGLVRNRKGPSGDGGALDQYVNDRPYVASSFMSVALAQVFRTAMSGKCKDHQELAEMPIPLDARISAVPCKGGEGLLRRLFEPLGYAVTTESRPLDEKFPEWGECRCLALDLQATVRLSDLLSHLYVLIPVMDDDKHYWIGDDEVEKLLRHGGDWLQSHPEKDLIVNRYLRHRRHLIEPALERLMEEDQPDPDQTEVVHAHEEEEIEERVSLNEQRLGAIVSALRSSGAVRVLDLGCGEGKLIRRLLDDRRFEEIVGLDVSHRTLEITARRLRLEDMPDARRDRVKLLHGSLTYRDARLSGYDAAAVIEVIEHLDMARLAAFERVLFEFARPGTVVLTTPNTEYNAKFEGLSAGKLRHRDHRFEWTRAEFESWARGVGDRFGYTVRFLPIGPVDPSLGAPTQMALFTLGGHNDPRES